MSEGNASGWGQARPPRRRRRVWSARGLTKPRAYARLPVAAVWSLGLHAATLALLLQLVSVQFGRPTQELFVFTDEVTSAASDRAATGTGAVDRDGPIAAGGAPGPSVAAEPAPGPQLPARTERAPSPITGPSVLPPLGELSGPGAVASAPAGRQPAPAPIPTPSRPAPVAPGLLPDAVRPSQVPPEALAAAAPGPATTPAVPRPRAPGPAALESTVPLPSVTSSLLPETAPRTSAPPRVAGAAPVPQAAPDVPRAQAPETGALASPVPVPTVTSTLLSEAAPRTTAPSQAAVAAPAPQAAPEAPRAQAPEGVALASPVPVPAVTSTLLSEAAPRTTAPSQAAVAAPAPRAAPEAPRAQAPEGVALASPVPAPAVTSTLLSETAPPTPAPTGAGTGAAPAPRVMPSVPRARGPEAVALASPVPVPAVTSRLAEQAPPLAQGVPAGPVAPAVPAPRSAAVPAQAPAPSGAGTGLLESPIVAPPARRIALAPLAEQLAPALPVPSGESRPGSGAQGLPSSTALQTAPSLPRATAPEVGGGGPVLPELLGPRSPGRTAGERGSAGTGSTAGTGTAPAVGTAAGRLPLGSPIVGVPGAETPETGTLPAPSGTQVAIGRVQPGAPSGVAPGQGAGGQPGELRDSTAAGGAPRSAGSGTDAQTATGGIPSAEGTTSTIASRPAVPGAGGDPREAGGPRAGAGTAPAAGGGGPASSEIARGLTGGFPGLPERGVRAGLPGVGSPVPLPGTESGREPVGQERPGAAPPERRGQVVAGQDGRAGDEPGRGGEDEAGGGGRRGSAPAPPGSPFGIAITEPVNGFRISSNDPPLVVVRGRVDDRGVSSVVLTANGLRITAPVMGGWFEAVVPAVDPIVRIQAEILAGATRRRSQEIIVHADAARPAAVLVLDWGQTKNHPELDVTATWRGRPDRADDPMTPVPVKGLPAYSRVFYLQDMKPGVYAFSLGYKGADVPLSGTLYFGGGDTQTTATPLRRVRLSGAGRTILARFLLPFGVFWDDDKWFTGKSESVDTITKFRFPEGVSWVERKGGGP